MVGSGGDVGGSLSWWWEVIVLFRVFDHVGMITPEDVMGFDLFSDHILQSMHGFTTFNERQFFWFF